MIKKQFEKKGKTFEIRQISQGNGISVQVFDSKNNCPVSPPIHIDHECFLDCKFYGIDPLKEIFRIAKNEFFRDNFVFDENIGTGK
jgi:hypothetical protein